MLRVIAEHVPCDQKTNSDYVRFVSMFYFHFVPYVLDIRYFTVCAICVRHMLEELSICAKCVRHTLSFFRYKSILSTVKFHKILTKSTYSRKCSLLFIVFVVMLIDFNKFQ